MLINKKGKLICKICGKEINEEDAIFLPNFEANENAPLAIFNDAIVHKSCLEQHSLRDKLNKRLDELEKLAQLNDVDYITKQDLSLENLGHPDNLVNVFYITEDENDPLYKYNGISLNKNNLSKWSDYKLFLQELEELERSDKWGGRAIGVLITQLTSPIKKPYSLEFLEKMKQRYNN